LKAGTKEFDEAYDIVKQNTKIKIRTTPLSPNDIKSLADTKGWRKVNKISHGEAIYYDPVNKVYISKDNTIHNGGALKIAKTIENLERKETRMGTYTIVIENINGKEISKLVRIGD
jgi:hypothetical protein